MPRQNFLSRESFVTATEQQAKDSLLSIPAFVSNITLIGENKMIQSFKFCYSMPVKNIQYHVDVSMLPLNEQYMRISLHGRHAGGQAFSHDADMAIALHDFEAALQAALKGDTALYKPYQPKVRNRRKVVQFVAAFVTSITMIVLNRKLS